MRDKYRRRKEAAFAIATAHRTRRRIGAGYPAFVIAEAGVNHNGDVLKALELVDVAAAAGADAVKFQTFRTDAVVTARGAQAAYQQRQAPAGSQRDMLRGLELPESAHRCIMDRAAERGVTFLSTPFDYASANFLFTLGVPAFKIPSGEITNLRFVRYIAKFGRPVILSTGMSTMDEVRAAVDAIRRAGNPPLALLHCVSCYPAEFKHLNLHAMHTLRNEFGVPVGYSDHTLGTSAAVAATALGAAIIEKHVTLDRTLPGPDHAASLEPDEFGVMVNGIRDVEQALGSGIKEPAAPERAIARVARRSLVTATEIPRGARITDKMLTCKRPGTGLLPAEQTRVVGRRAGRSLPADHLLRWSDLK